MRRLPIRLRLTVAFTAVVAAVLTVLGVFAYHHLASGVSDDLDRELRQRAQDLVGPVSRPGSSLSDLAGTGFIERGESFAELVTPSGGVLQATQTLRSTPLLSAAEAARASTETLIVDRPQAPGLDEPARLLATPVDRDGQRLVLVLGDTRENGIEALHRVRTQLLVGLPAMLVVTSICAYLLASAALRPVEEMRRQAARMSVGAAGQRLPLPPGDDEVVRLGTTLNALLARVDATVARERSFVATASHELRTPLALLRTRLELAVRRPRAALELTSAIDSARDDVDDLIRLAENLLLLARMDDADLVVAPDVVDVPTLVEGVTARFEDLAARDGRPLRAEATQGLEVSADRARLEQALVNLVGNAVQHGDGGIRLSVRPGADAVEFHVTDEGRGLSVDMLAHGFERFACDGPRKGTGLGLAIVAAIADAHGGCVGMGNWDSGGADVWFSLPSR